MHACSAGQNFGVYSGQIQKLEQSTVFLRNTVFTEKECLKEFIVDCGGTRDVK